ncbi:MAG: Rieske (2Fe-2S) protein [Acidobacteriota bacterium]
MPLRDTARREFLKVGCVGLSATVLGLCAAEVQALPTAFIEGAQSGSERSYPIPASDSVNIDRDRQVIVVRAARHVYVFSLSCPHQNNAVKWVAKESRFQCTKHDSQYQADGVHTAGRATRNLDRYLIRREGDQVIIDLHRWVQSDKDPTAWTAATVDV